MREPGCTLLPIPDWCLLKAWDIPAADFGASWCFSSPVQAPASRLAPSSWRRSAAEPAHLLLSCKSADLPYGILVPDLRPPFAVGEPALVCMRRRESFSCRKPLSGPARQAA